MSQVDQIQEVQLAGGGQNPDDPPVVAPPEVQVISIGKVGGGPEPLTPAYGWIAKTVEPHVNGVELLLMVIVVLTTAMSVRSMAKPKESDFKRNGRAASLLLLVTLLTLCYIVRIFMDHRIDHANYFYYKAKLNNRKVFYYKGIIHLFAFLTLVASFVVAIVNWFKIKKHPAEPIIIYWAGFGCNIVNGVAYILTYYRMIPKSASVRRQDGRIFTRRLERCTDIPPQGRVLFYESRPDLAEEELV